jgi:hypothetical protein
VGIRVERYTPAYVDAVRAFNGRLTARHAVPGFLLDETPPAADDRPPLQREHFLAVETGGEVRGGFMLQRQTFAIGGRLASVVNYQAPISEGIADRRYAYLGMLMVKEALRHDPLMFCLGMGSLAQPLPRLLAALGFNLRAVPVLVRVHRAARVLRMLPSLRTERRRARLADLASRTGAGWLAFRGWARLADLTSRRSSAVESERVDGWDSWVDALWERARETCSMVAVRDASALTALYSRSDARNICLRVSQAGRPVGWAVLFDTAMRGSPHFGDLRVGTVLDCWALPGCEPAVIQAATRTLERRGVDLVITNQSHAGWVAAFRRAGYLSGPSNYILAMSPALTGAVRAEAQGETRIHVTRGDADGRIHL